MEAAQEEKHMNTNDEAKETTDIERGSTLRSCFLVNSTQVELHLSLITDHLKKHSEVVVSVLHISIGQFCYNEHYVHFVNFFCE